MANNFVLNLRAVRSEANSKASNMANNTKTPITRGDMQKQRQAQSKVEKAKEQMNINEVPAQSIDRMSPEQAQQFERYQNQEWAQADKGTLFLDPKIKEQMSADDGALFMDDIIRRYATRDIFDNYDRLNKILDDYDLAETWSGKYKVIENAIKSFGEDMPQSIYDWLDEINYQTSMGSLYGGRNPKDISDYMRQLNNTIRRIMSPKRI